MKHLLFILLAIFSLSYTSYIAYAGEEEAPEQKALKDKDIVIKADGMVCDFCVQSLKKFFGKEDSVIDIFVDMDEHAIFVDTKDGQTLSDDKIKELIEWGGYDLVSIERLES